MDEKTDMTKKAQQAASLYAGNRVILDEITALTRKLIKKLHAAAVWHDQGHNKSDDIYQQVKCNVLDTLQYSIWYGLHEKKDEIIKAHCAVIRENMPCL